MNSESTIRDTIHSVINQNYKDIEYIIIDGGSKDDTISIINEYSHSVNKFFTEVDNGIYDAMNKGIMKASGDIIGILNSDDMYADQNVISDVVNNYKNTKCNIIFGNLVYFDNNNPSEIIRTYSSNNFKPWKLRFGWMPPHPATFFHKSIYENYGLYSTDYKTGADYEMFVRLLMKYKLPYFHIKRVYINMRDGGATTSGFSSIFTTSSEMVKSVKANGFYTNIFLIYLRLPIKFFETLNFPKPKVQEISN